MKDVLKAMLVIALLLTGSPALAQFGGLGGSLKKAVEQKEKIDELTISETEERSIGEDVSAKIRERFGVVQDVAVHKYVALVGMTLAKASDRPNLAWTFVVLDTDGVNAFASPGGLVHVTRGALGLIRSEAELAGVLAHEIGHVTRKHTINAIRKNKAVQMGTKETLSDRAPLLDQLANRAYEMVLENNFDRGDELDADKVSVDLTQKVGYASGSLGDFLTRLDDRNKDQPEKNGLFASHPEMKERIAKIKQMAAAKNGALVEARYKSNIKYEPTLITSIAAVPAGASGLTGSTKSAEQTQKKDESKDAPKEEPKKKGFGIGSLKQTVAPEKESAQVSASGGARGVGPDRAAKGGGNPAIVKTNVTAGELATFKKSIA
jgi:Zn-dependent protease with chaperone function